MARPADALTVAESLKAVVSPLAVLRPEGVSALDLVRTARDHGMRVRAISLQRNDFRFVKLPAIVHWEFNHFLVVERWSRSRVDVVDPARGRHRLTPQEFDAGFTDLTTRVEPRANWNYLCANCYNAGTTTPAFPEYQVFTVAGVTEITTGTFDKRRPIVAR